VPDRRPRIISRKIASARSHGFSWSDMYGKPEVVGYQEERPAWIICTLLAKRKCYSNEVFLNRFACLDRYVICVAINSKRHSIGHTAIVHLYYAAQRRHTAPPQHHFHLNVCIAIRRRAPWSSPSMPCGDPSDKPATVCRHVYLSQMQSIRHVRCNRRTLTIVSSKQHTTRVWSAFYITVGLILSACLLCQSSPFPVCPLCESVSREAGWSGIAAAPTWRGVHCRWPWESRAVVQSTARPSSISEWDKVTVHRSPVVSPVGGPSARSAGMISGPYILGLDRYRVGDRYSIPETISHSCTDTGNDITHSLGHTYVTYRKRV